jgi:type III secretory pathway component EscV
MTRGKPWNQEEETLLRELIKANTSLETITEKLNRKPGAIHVKCLRLGLTRGQHYALPNIPLPKGLPSVEDALRKLAKALETASTPGLSYVEVQRLQVLSSLTKTYDTTMSHYLNYREVESKMEKMEAKFNEFLKETTKSMGLKAVSTQMAESPASQPQN